ncbi:MAG TPA: LysR family transcriptional regulator [Gallicola sp.]|nr:LysR family transcriptional regulator [Gallicola sp.]
MQKIGGIIVVGNENDSGRSVDPLSVIGSISVIKREVLTFQQAEVYPKIIVLGKENYDLERHLWDYDVIFLHNKDNVQPTMINLVKIGLEYLYDKVDRVLITPVSVPMFKFKTLLELINTEGDIVSPSFKRKSGHPILLDRNIFDIFLNSNLTMRETVRSLQNRRRFLNVKDEGIIHSIDEMESVSELLAIHNTQILHPFLRINIEKEVLFFDSRTKLLFQLINEVGSVKQACNHMALSYSKAWNMIKVVEEALGFEVVKRRHGGKQGGNSILTEKGKDYLDKYMEFDREVRRFANRKFNEIFVGNEKLENK